MARKNKKTKTKSKPKQKSRINKEVQGLSLIVAGILILISLSSRAVQGSENILGDYLGVALSDALSFIAGSVPVFIIPFIFVAAGWRLFRGKNTPASVRKIVFFAILFLELCALLSVNAVRVVPSPGMLLGGGGYIGSFVANNIFISLFGRRAFGPYFVTLSGIFITVVWGARLRLGHFVETANTLKTLYLDLQEEILARWAPEHTNATGKKPKIKSGKPEKITSDREIREEEKNRQQDERRKLKEKQEEFLRKKSGLAPQIATRENEKNEPAQETEAESSAEKHQRMRAELEAGELAKQEQSPDETEVQETPVAEPSTRSIPVIAGIKHDQEEKIKYEPYVLPALDLLKNPPPVSESVSNEELDKNSKILEEKMGDFGVLGKVVNVHPGPIITRYEVELAPGIKVSKIQNLSDDLAMAMKALRVRILAPIPGKAAVGIELPNPKPSTIFMREILASEKFPGAKNLLPLALGKTITGEPYVADLTRMPHLLIAGQTGSGKSVCINSIISSILYCKSPEECRLLLVDPKVVELALYNDIPHLFAPVVTDSREAIKCLKWAVVEMERRYKLLAKIAVRNIVGFNDKLKKGQIKEGKLSTEENQKLPYIIIIIDELADLMMTAANEVESSIVRLAQLARAVGIHLIVATQRPSANVLTGLIKANMPSRIAFQVASKIDSRVILDQNGAEKLLGRGDMLFVPPGVSEVLRLHGAFVSDNETEAIVETVRHQKVKAERLESWGITEEISLDEEKKGKSSSPTDADLFIEAAKLVVRHQIGSTSLIQRRLKVGYARAGRLMDDLEDARIVGANNGSKARDVLIDESQLDDVLAARRGSR